MFKVKRGRRLIAQSLGVVAVGGGLALAVTTTGVALPQYPVVLHQTPPITATGFDGHGNDCGNASNQDGWFFVLPANTTAFSTLDITFSNGSIVSGPTFLHGGKQATIVTTAGAILESGSGEVTTTTGVAPAKNWFNLSHTCPASSTSPPPSPSTSPKPSGSPSGSPHPSGSPSSPPPGAPTPTPVTGNLPVTG